ncbi:MAG TPA: decarboxylating 6-phosphogluconate dehydrogenase [Burkholderiales bacterium]|nr:decarboxylating 6-phosphogluconate dehydrogenase [Burkholderiales bacterium]
MQIGIVGLGRMGGNMARRLARGGVRVLGFDRERAARAALAGEKGVECVDGLAALCAHLPGERVVLTMLPAGSPSEDALAELAPLLSAGDLVVDGANAFYKDSMRRALELSRAGLRFVDAGVSGGIHGLAQGYCLMLGGTPKSIEMFAPFARILAPGAERGWMHCGASGAGHFAKMVHNGIEYGMMQALAEGLALVEARADFGIDRARLAETWRHGSVVGSWLLDLCAEALAADPSLAGIAPVVADSGEGRWTVLESVELGVPAPVITMALMSRFSSQGRADYARKLLATLRAKFGGHAVTRS